MNIPDAIMDHLMAAYRPEAVIVYGSFADGTAGDHSDFDALIIADHVKTHDASVIGGTVLDVFVYPPETFESDYDPEAFIQVFDGIIRLDRRGLATQLKERVLDHLSHEPRKTDDELRQAIDWCEKMLARTAREDSEGFYRWHWLLSDSLEIYCDLMRLRYFGPKKALRHMAQADPEAFGIYSAALREMDRKRLEAWVKWLRVKHNQVEEVPSCASYSSATGSRITGGTA